MLISAGDVLCLTDHVVSRYAAKMEHEGAAMYDAATALRDAMIELGLACDGGKDSLSMAASAGGEVSLQRQLCALPNECAHCLMKVCCISKRRGAPAP